MSKDRTKKDDLRRDETPWRGDNQNMYIIRSNERSIGQPKAMGSFLAFDARIHQLIGTA